MNIKTGRLNCSLPLFSVFSLRPLEKTELILCRLEIVLALAIASVRVMDSGPALLQPFLTAKKRWVANDLAPKSFFTLTHKLTNEGMEGLVK